MSEEEEQNTTLFVRGCTNEDKLREEFEKFGAVKDIYAPNDYYTRRKKGIAFVTFNELGHAQEACKQLDKQQVDGKTIEVSFAHGNRKSPNEMRRKGPSGRRSRSPRERRFSPSYYRRFSPRRRSRSPRRRDSRSPIRRRRSPARSYSRSPSPRRNLYRGRRERSFSGSPRRSPSPARNNNGNDVPNNRRSPSPNPAPPNKI